MKIIGWSLLFLLTALNVDAQLESCECKDGPHVGFVTGGDVRNEDFAFGWQASGKWNDAFSVELAITRQNDELQDRVDHELLPEGFTIDMETWAVALSARFSIEPIDRVRLYATGGIGYYFIKTDAEEARKQIDAQRSSQSGSTELMNFTVDVENSFGLLVGCGIEIDLSDHWELFAEYRHVSLTPDADVKFTEREPSSTTLNAPFLETTTLIPDTLSYDHALVRMGLNYRF